MNSEQKALDFDLDDKEKATILWLRLSDAYNKVYNMTKGKPKNEESENVLDTLSLAIRFCFDVSKLK